MLNEIPPFWNNNDLRMGIQFLHDYYSEESKKSYRLYIDIALENGYSNNIVFLHITY